MFVQLLENLLRPLLKVGHCIWHPESKGLCYEIENVQKKATQLLSHLKGKTYNERLENLKFQREKEGIRLRCSRILKKTFRKLGLPNLQDQIPINRKTIRETNKQYISQTELFFSHRCINTWNSRPDSVVNAETINSFKNRLDDN